MLKTLITISVIAIILVLLPLISRIPLIFQSPKAAYEDFLDTTNQAEDMLMDPLILAGESVVPLVLEGIKSKDMKLRRYAIHFLGNGKYKQALPQLEEILNDETEKDYFRGDALASIFNIDRKIGMSFAEKYKSHNDFLGRHAKMIVTGKNNFWVQRTFWEAFRNIHH